MASTLQLALVATLLVAVHAAKNVCTPDDLKAAQMGFNQQLGIDNSNGWATPVSLAISIQNIFINGPKNGSSDGGLIAVCNAYNIYLATLSNRNVDYNSCFDPRFLIKNDVTPILGYAYAGLMRMLSYQCGAGLFPAMSTWTCIRNTYNVRNTTLLGCLNSLHLDAESNYTAACSYTKTAIQCWTQQFIQTCQNNNEINYYACETVRSYTSAAYGECNDRCFIVGKPSFAVDVEAEKLKEMTLSAKKVAPIDSALLNEVRAKYLKTE